MECPFKKRKIEENADDNPATSIAVIDELISNSNENMPESLNELEIVEEDVEEAGGENSGEDLF
jgi:hypothetical protein